MSVFRIEKNRNYTAMSNYHLRDRRLSLRTIGLLSVMLSLPENWDYSQVGLSKICKDGVTAISSALQELEAYGYLVRERSRNEAGMMTGIIYHVYEVPKELLDQGITDPPMPSSRASGSPIPETPQKGRPSKGSPQSDHPQSGFPIMDRRMTDSPVPVPPAAGIPGCVKPESEQSGQENIYPKSNDSKKQKTNNDGISDPSILPSGSIAVSDGSTDGCESETSNGLTSYTAWVEQLKRQINYGYFVTQEELLNRRLTEDQHFTRAQYDEAYNYCCITLLDEIIGYMADIMNSNSTKPIRVGTEYIDREVFKYRLRMADVHKMRNILYTLRTGNIKNRKAYALSMLYN